jgi:hypothetical protein
MRKTSLPLAICLLLIAFPLLSFALTVDEVLHLKQEGVSDETIQLMIQQEMQRERLSDPNKNIGVHRVVEPDGKSATIYSTGENERRDDCEEETEREKRDKAWEMLHNIVIDTREEGKNKDEKNSTKDR